MFCAKITFSVAYKLPGGTGNPLAAIPLRAWVTAWAASLDSRSSARS